MVCSFYIEIYCIFLCGHICRLADCTLLITHLPTNSFSKLYDTSLSSASTVGSRVCVLPTYPPTHSENCMIPLLAQHPLTQPQSCHLDQVPWCCLSVYLTLDMYVCLLFHSYCIFHMHQGDCFHTGDLYLYHESEVLLVYVLSLEFILGPGIEPWSPVL